MSGDGFWDRWKSGYYDLRIHWWEGFLFGFLVGGLAFGWREALDFLLGFLP